MDDAVVGNYGTPRIVRVTAVGDGRVVSTPAGIDCPGQCAAEFPDGTAVTLVPSAASGSHFASWDGTCRGSTNCALQLSADVELTVGFEGLGQVWTQQQGGAGADAPHGMTVDSAGTILVVGEFAGTANFGATQLTSTGGQDAYVVGYAPDGTVRFAFALGGTGDDRAWAVAAPLDPWVFQTVPYGFAVAGEFTGSMTIGTTTLVSNGGADAFVAFFGPDGTLVWARSFGGTGDDVARGVGITPAPLFASLAPPNVTVTGAFSGSADFGGGTVAAVGTADLFAARYDASDGAFTWVRTFGAAGATVTGYAAAHDNNDDSLVAGAFTASVDFGGGAQASAGGTDGFVLALDATGAYVWARRFGDTGDDAAYGVSDSAPQYDTANMTPRAQELVGVTGTFAGTVDLGTGAITSSGMHDGFVAAYQPDGTPMWAHALGGPDEDAGNAIALDRSGSVSVAGTFAQTIDVGGTTFTSSGGTDGFAAKLNPAGTLQAGKRMGGAGNDGCSAIGMNSVIVAGTFEQTADVGGVQLTSAGASDGFAVKYSVGASTTAVAAGVDFVCALRSDGGVYCWGWSDYNTFLDPSVTAGDWVLPWKIPYLPTIRAITAGEDHVCVLDDSGAVWCWGTPGGNLGDGVNHSGLLYMPVQVVGLTGPVAQLAANEDTTCARLVSGAVQCFGDATYGQRGDGVAGDTTYAAGAPVMNISDAVELVAASNAFCVRHPGGTVSCWGDNRGGQLGAPTSACDAAQTTAPCSAVPVDVNGLTDATALGAGRAHVCAVRQDASMVCWGGLGGANLGVLGNGTDQGSITPVPVQGIAGAKQVVAGATSTCAVLQSGQVMCWGSEGLGVPGVTQSYVPLPALGLDDVIQAASGHFGSFAPENTFVALRASGGVMTWGPDTVESAGNGSYGVEYDRPVAVVGLP